jgi:hypothetical protein
LRKIKSLTQIRIEDQNRQAFEILKLFGPF